jgi:MFS family permease
MNPRAIAVLFACFSTIFAAFAIRYSYGTLLPGMLPEFAITKAQAGVIYSSYFIAYTIFSPIMGLLTNRTDTRMVLAIFVTLMGGGALLMHYANSVVQASLCFSLAGFGCSACWAPVMALAQRWSHDKHRGLTLSIVDLGSSLGVMAAGTVVPMVIASSGWRTGWLVLGIMGITLGGINFILVRDRPPAQSAALFVSSAEPVVSPGEFYKQLFGDRRFWFIGFAYMLTGFAVIIPFAFISTYAVQELSFPYDTATRLVSIIGLAGIAGRLVLGPVPDRMGRIRILAICALLMAGGCLGMAYGRGWWMTAFVVIFGLGYGACWAMYAACAADIFSKKAAGGIIGLWTVFLGIGSIAGPMLAGWTADASGTLMWSFMLAMAASIVALLLLLPLLKTPRPGIHP